jgi:hypothetical protein
MDTIEKFAHYAYEHDHVWTLDSVVRPYANNSPWAWICEMKTCCTFCHTSGVGMCKSGEVSVELCETCYLAFNAALEKFARDSQV